MAGSLSHITDDVTGEFRDDLVENGKDMLEALEECHQIIAYLICNSRNPKGALAKACREMSFPAPYHIPVIQPGLHGANSIFKDKP